MNQENKQRSARFHPTHGRQGVQRHLIVHDERKLHQHHVPAANGSFQPMPIGKRTPNAHQLVEIPFVLAGTHFERLPGLAFEHLPNVIARFGSSVRMMQRTFADHVVRHCQPPLFAYRPSLALLAPCALFSSFVFRTCSRLNTG